MDHIRICKLKSEELQEAMELVWRVFLEFEAPEYDPAGVIEFQRYISLPSMRQMHAAEETAIWLARLDETLAGVLAVRPPCHISLLFVDKEYHRKGIAKALMEAVLKKHSGVSGEATVNSSPYAAEAYRHMGFRDTDMEQTVNGLRFIPMKRKL